MSVTIPNQVGFHRMPDAHYVDLDDAYLGGPAAALGLRPGSYLVAAVYVDYYLGPVLTVLAYVVRVRGRLVRCYLQ